MAAGKEEKRIMVNSSYLLPSLISFFLSAFLGIVSLLFCRFFSGSKNGEKKSFRNSFPFEFYSSRKGPLAILVRVFFHATLFAGVFGVSFFFFGVCESPYRKAVGISLLVSLRTMLSLHYRSMRLIRLRRAVSVVSFLSFDYAAFRLSISILTGKALLTGEKSMMKVPVCVVFGLLTLIGLLCFFNPKFYTWFKMDKAEVDGTIYYDKPKWNFYAFYEWAFFLAQCLSFLLLGTCALLYRI